MSDELKQQPFERYPALASWMEKLGNNSLMSLGNWMTFVGALNNAILTAERRPSEQQPAEPRVEGQPLGQPTTASRTHVPLLEQHAENQRPKTNEWAETKLYRYDGTDLYQWFGRRVEGIRRTPSVFWDACDEPFAILALAALPATSGGEEDMASRDHDQTVSVALEYEKRPGKVLCEEAARTLRHIATIYEAGWAWDAAEKLAALSSSAMPADREKSRDDQS